MTSKGWILLSFLVLVFLDEFVTHLIYEFMVNLVLLCLELGLELISLVVDERGSSLGVGERSLLFNGTSSALYLCSILI